MVGVQGLRSTLEDASWRYPIVLGLASVPFTLYAAWPTLGELSPPVFVVGFLAAFLYYERGDVESFTIGGRAGLVALVPIAWWLVEGLEFALVNDSPLWFRVMGFGLVVAFLFPVSLAIAYVVGGLGGKLGGWLAERTTTRLPAIPAP